MCFFLTAGPRFHIFIKKSHFGHQGGADKVLKGGSPDIKVIAKVVVALRIVGAVARVNAVSILACGTACVTNAAAVRKDFVYAGGTKSGKDSFSQSSSFQSRLSSPRIGAQKKVLVLDISVRARDCTI